MQRRLFFVFGLFCHVLFFPVFAYMAGFVGNFIVPKSIDAPAVAGPVWVAVVIDLILLAAFTVPHSVMARPGFKRWWTGIVPAPIERSVYVLVSCLLMIALLAFWRPIDRVIFDIANPLGRVGMWTLFVTGWLLVPAASLMINHFDLFGTRQVWLHLQQKAYTHLPFHTPLAYKLVRHPLYVGWITAFWATPTMTAGHLFFAVFLTTYMLVAIQFEERDLVDHFGEKYTNYRNRVGGLIPRLPQSREEPLGNQELAQ